MTPAFTSVKKILEEKPIEVSAPCRVDSGGTWDIKAMSLPFEHIEPVTVNIALTLRTRISLSPFREGYIKITSEGFKDIGAYSIKKSLPLNTPFGLFLAAVCYFGFHGLEVKIASDSPVRSALGGSSTALVALLMALSILRTSIEGERLSRRQILHLGYIMEDGINGGNCGIQDQAAAVYGGVNLWTWRYSHGNWPFFREALLEGKDLKEMSKCVVVAFSGKGHVAARMNRPWVKDFLSGRTRSGWMKANETVKDLAGAIREKDWQSAASLLREEMKIRRRITPDALIPVTSKLIKRAEKIGCGARFAGAGGGGSLWAIGEPDRIRDLEEAWADMLAPVRGACVLRCNIDPSGVR